jgi:RNA polymerase sigma-70 factor (ECF subfamily)
LPRIAVGDHSAVRECIDRYGRLILAIAHRFLGRTSDAEDAVQDTFIELWKHAGRFDPRQGSELSFITTIARRRLIDGRRKAGRRPSAAPLPDTLPEPAERRECPFDLADEVVLARAALAELKDEQRSVILMAVNDGLTHGEIATQTGLPLGTVKTHIRRGLLTVRKRLTVGGQS